MENRIPDHLMSLSSEMQLAARAALAAGEIIANSYGQLQAMESKGVGDFVSEIDRQADRAIQEILKTDPAGRPILSEELSPELEGESDDIWIVDPLDGTSAFLFRTGPAFSSVLIARYSSGESQLGIVYFPVTGEWFYAERGQGAFVDGQPLRCSDNKDLTGGWVELNQFSDVRYESAEFRSMRDSLRTENGAALVTQNAPYSGVAMRVAEAGNFLVAAVHDNHAEEIKQAAWDIAAPQCVLEEAGGVFVNFSGERVHPFRPEPFLVAGSQRVCDQILELRTASE